MEIVAILRVLWRRRLLLIPGVLAAIAISLVVGGGSSAPTGLAWTRMALDTVPSQNVLPVASGADTLGWRATLLAELMTSEDMEERVAHDAGIQADRLAIVEPLLDEPAAPTALPRRAAKAAATRWEPYVLVLTADEPLATISLEARAPDRAAASRLAEAGAAALEASAPAADAPKVQPYVVERVASIKAEDVTGGGGRMMAVAAALVVLGLWCGAVAIVPARRGRDDVSERRRSGAPSAA